MSGAGPAELLDVLVLDDAAALCDLLRVALRARQVATANSGPIALRLLLAAMLRVKLLVDRLKCDEGIVPGGWREVRRQPFRKRGDEVVGATHQAIVRAGSNGRYGSA